MYIEFHHSHDFLGFISQYSFQTPCIRYGNKLVGILKIGIIQTKSEKE